MQKIIDNPFLRSSPFKKQERFFSHPNAHCIDSYPLQQNEKKQYAEVSFNMEAFEARKKLREEKKISNPFFRKNLVSCLNAKELYYDDIEFSSIVMNKGPIEKPEFLCNKRNSILDNIRPITVTNIRSPSTPCSRKSIGKQNLNLGSRPSLISPRFPSIANIGAERRKSIYDTERSNSQSCSINSCKDEKEVRNLNDGYPLGINVRGHAYYRNMMHFVGA